MKHWRIDAGYQGCNSAVCIAVLQGGNIASYVEGWLSPMAHLYDIWSSPKNHSYGLQRGMTRLQQYLSLSLSLFLLLSAPLASSFWKFDLSHKIMTNRSFFFFYIFSPRLIFSFFFSFFLLYRFLYICPHLTLHINSSEDSYQVFFFLFKLLWILISIRILQTEYLTSWNHEHFKVWGDQHRSPETSTQPVREPRMKIYYLSVIFNFFLIRISWIKYKHIFWNLFCPSNWQKGRQLPQQPPHLGFY